MSKLKNEMKINARQRDELDKKLIKLSRKTKIMESGAEPRIMPLYVHIVLASPSWNIDSPWNEKTELTLRIQKIAQWLSETRIKSLKSNHVGLKKKRILLEKMW